MPAHSAELKGQKRATKPAGEAFITPEPPHELQASFSFTLGFLEGEAGPDVPVSDTVSDRKEQGKDRGRLPSDTRTGSRSTQPQPASHPAQISSRQAAPSCLAQP